MSEEAEVSRPRPLYIDRDGDYWYAVEGDPYSIVHSPGGAPSVMPITLAERNYGPLQPYEPPRRGWSW